MLGSLRFRAVPVSRRAALEVLLRRLSMVRLSAVALATLAVACTGEIVDPSGDAAKAAAAAFKSNVEPTLTSKCGVCHTGTAFPQFMKPDPTLRDGVLKFDGGKLLNLDDPQTEPPRGLRVEPGPRDGRHQLPAGRGGQGRRLGRARGAGRRHESPAPTIETPVITPVVGQNTIDLGALGLTGTTFKFDYQPLATGMYLSRISVTAGAGGVRLTHPLFVVWDGNNPVPDPIDRFGDIDLTVAEMTSSSVGGGTAVFVDVPPTAPLSLYFKAATFANGMPPSTDGGATGGCKAVAQFTAAVRGPLTASCTSCHAGGNAGATAATDMTKLADDAQQMAACAQILSRVSKLTPDQSALFVSAQPNSGLNHPFKFPSDTEFQAFKAAILPWITAEAAP
jgi:cytochrome c553